MKYAHDSNLQKAFALKLTKTLNTSTIISIFLNFV